MDELLVALGITLPLVIGLAWAIWWLVAGTWREQRRRRAAAGYEGRFMGNRERPAHVFRGQGEAITVAELLEEVQEHGEGVRLNWPDEALDRAGWVRPYVQDQFPTAILPRVRDE